MKAVSVAAFNSRGEAELLRDRLRAAGIAAEIREELRLEAGMDFGRPSAGVRIEVPRDEFEAALRWVYDWNAGGEGPPEPPEWLIPESTARPARAHLRPDDGQGEVR